MGLCEDRPYTLLIIEETCPQFFSITEKSIGIVRVLPGPNCLAHCPAHWTASSVVLYSTQGEHARYPAADPENIKLKSTPVAVCKELIYKEYHSVCPLAGMSRIAQAPFVQTHPGAAHSDPCGVDASRVSTGSFYPGK